MLERNFTAQAWNITKETESKRIIRTGKYADRWTERDGEGMGLRSMMALWKQQGIQLTSAHCHQA